MLIAVNDPAIFSCDEVHAMNDFLRPCNCVHPSGEECEKCIEEAAECPPVGSDKKVPEQADPKPPGDQIPA